MGYRVNNVLKRGKCKKVKVCWFWEYFVSSSKSCLFVLALFFFLDHRQVFDTCCCCSMIRNFGWLSLVMLSLIFFSGLRKASCAWYYYLLTRNLGWLGVWQVEFFYTVPLVFTNLLYLCLFSFIRPIGHMLFLEISSVHDVQYFLKILFSKVTGSAVV